MSLITVPWGIIATANLLEPMVRNINIIDINTATALNEITK